MGFRCSHLWNGCWVSSILCWSAHTDIWKDCIWEGKVCRDVDTDFNKRECGHHGWVWWARGPFNHAFGMIQLGGVHWHTPLENFENLEYLPFTWENQQIPLENQIVCAIPFRNLQNIGCDLRRCSFSTLFSLFSWFWFTSRSLLQDIKFYSFMFTYKISTQMVCVSRKHH